MDSVTQMALGAAVGELVLGRRIGNKALLLGAVVGSLPDLDVLVPFEGAIESFTYHRSVTHSLIVLSFVSPLIAWVLLKLIRSTEIPFKHWWLMTWLALVTHPLLDGFTVYGTQLFWPLSEYPVSGSSVFIIDPAFTLILIAGLLFAFRRGAKGHLINSVALLLACSYLAWSMVAKKTAHKFIENALAEQGITYRQLMTTPMPFNTLGWRFVAMQDNAYRTGYYSLLDPPNNQIKTFAYASDESLLDSIEDHWPVERLRFFTHGFYKVQRIENEVQMVDLRMGIEKSYIFSFTVGEVTTEGRVIAVKNREANSERDFSALKDVMRRVIDPTVDLQQR